MGLTGPDITDRIGVDISSGSRESADDLGSIENVLLVPPLQECLLDGKDAAGGGGTGGNSWLAALLLVILVRV